jgi:hypothetical protein
VADDIVLREPVCALKYPANREKIRVFFVLGPFFRAAPAEAVAIPVGYERIPYAVEQGRNWLDLGVVFREQGKIS